MISNNIDYIDDIDLFILFKEYLSIYYDYL